MSVRHASVLVQGAGWTLCALLALTGWRLALTRLEARLVQAEAAAATREAEIRRLQRAAAVWRQTVPAPAAQPPPASAPPESVELPQPSSPEALRSQAVVTLASLVKAQTLRITPSPRIPAVLDRNSPKAPDPLQPDASGAFPAEFAQLFTLSETGFEILRQEMIALRNRVEVARAQQTTVGLTSDGSLALTTPPLSEGAALKQEFRQILLRALGPANLAAFVAMRSDPLYEQSGGIGFDAFFHGFGVGQAVYTITRQTPQGFNQGRGQPYMFKTELGIPGIRPTVLGAQTAAQVREALGTLAPLLPGDF